MNEIAEYITKHLSSLGEILAALVTGLALLQFLYRYIINIFRSNVGTINQDLRISFGSALTVALEQLLGAAILATAFAPAWDWQTCVDCRIAYSA
jgi:uncharacterized membrane protein